MAIDFLDELRWRGLIHQCTDEAGLREHLAGGTRKAYVGYDPTADSLTIGNLVTIMMLVHFARAGHAPVVVMGGGTGLIGDPSGKSAERQLQTAETVAANVERQRGIFERVFAGAAEAPPRIVNNIAWLGTITYLEALRDIGKHFSVNMMMQKESVKARLTEREQGISYTEFSYMILQAYDFAHLYEHEKVTVQMGGSDQYGNIVAGTDLIRRRTVRADPEHDGAASASEREAVFGLTCPLITKADGGKFGKTESGAIWLTAARTSPYAYYQFWLNTSDDDVIKFLKVFTLLTERDISDLQALMKTDPGARPAQTALAERATALLHGEDAMRNAQAAAKALFSGEIAGLDEATLREVLAEVPSSAHPRTALDGDGVDPVDLLVETGLAKSKREAREFLAAGSITVNGTRLGEGERLTTSRLLHGSVLAIRRGRKQWHVTRWG